MTPYPTMAKHLYDSNCNQMYDINCDPCLAGRVSDITNKSVYAQLCPSRDPNRSDSVLPNQPLTLVIVPEQPLVTDLDLANVIHNICEYPQTNPGVVHTTRPNTGSHLLSPTPLPCRLVHAFESGLQDQPAPITLPLLEGSDIRVVSQPRAQGVAFAV